MPDRCCQHLPRPHIPCPWSWEALCCLLTVERCPPSGHRLRQATCPSSAVSPGLGAHRRLRPFRFCSGFLAADRRRGAPRARRHQPAAGLVERRGLDRGRGPRRRGRAPRPMPGPPRRPGHRARGGPRHGRLRRLPHRPRLPAHQRRPGGAAAPVAVHRAAGAPGAQRAWPGRRARPRPVDHYPRRTAHRLAPRLLAPVCGRLVRPLLPPPPAPPSPPPPAPPAPAVPPTDRRLWNVTPHPAHLQNNLLLRLHLPLFTPPPTRG